MSRTSPLTFGAIVNSRINSQFKVDPDTTTGLTFGHTGGTFSLHGAVATVTAGTVALTDDATNIVQVTSSGSVSAVVDGSGNETGFALFRVTTASSVITDIEDLRASLI